MGKRMLMYHVGIPVAVLVVLLVVGMPLATAAGAAMMAGCASMALMMVGGAGPHGPRPPADQPTTNAESRPPAPHH